MSGRRSSGAVLALVLCLGAGVARAEGPPEAAAAGLEAARRDPGASGRRDVIEALERDLAGFPDGPVRAEARLFVADAWWHPLASPGRAVPLLEAALADPAADGPTRALALSELVALDRELGRLDAAAEAVERYPELAPSLRDDVLRLGRRERLRRGALVVLAALATAALGSIARAVAAGRRGLGAALFRPGAIAFGLYLGGGAALIVRARGEGDPLPFLLLGLGLAGMDLVASALRIGARRDGAAARSLRAVACVLGVLAVAFLAVDQTDPSYLENVGL